MGFDRFIDNERVTLKDTLIKLASSGNYKTFSVATGYWDLRGMVDIIDDLVKFDEVRILIGQEPIPTGCKNDAKFNVDDPLAIFPDYYFKRDLENLSTVSDGEFEKLKNVAAKLAEGLKTNKFKVKVFRKKRLHAKAYIFGDVKSDEAVGIIGSSNFTGAGLSKNYELNYLEDDTPRVVYMPQTNTQPNTHLSWFENLWNHCDAEDWNGDFADMLKNSKFGNMTYGAYDTYIKTLMELYPDEAAPAPKLVGETEDILYDFQNRSAGSLITKLNKMGCAMLSDSVGLGKTITAGGVIRNYHETIKNVKVRIIVPAGLKEQWMADLKEVLKLQQGVHYEIFTQEGIEALKKQTEKDKLAYKGSSVDLFVIDEAHNLRNTGSKRRAAVLDMLQASPSARVLLLTATPINNRLIDFSNQIQLGCKGQLSSVPVPMKTDNKTKSVDFFDALKQIESKKRRDENEGKKFDWKRHEQTIKSGISHYLVRTTRQGIQKMGEGANFVFPKTDVVWCDYDYGNDSLNLEFEGVEVNRLNLDILSQTTQLMKHPLDVFKDNEGKTESGESWVSNDVCDSFLLEVFQAISCFGFAPYRPDTYLRALYGKSEAEIDTEIATKSENERRRIKGEFSIHNLIRTGYLKRIESSAYAFKRSIENYLSRLQQFQMHLNDGKIVAMSDLSPLEDSAEGDVEEALCNLDENATNARTIVADPSIYEIEQMAIDVERDIEICKELLNSISAILKNDAKLEAFKKFIKENDGKVLIFSFFKDTIDFLKANLNDELPNAEFVSGQTADIVDITRRFSPNSKKYTLAQDEKEVNYLFATDALSEGQNLQDCGILVNYDLHWNPVRMIQRNGRINRLGSKFETVKVANFKPPKDLNAYLTLLSRLESKIDQINQTIGLDQDVLEKGEANPIEYLEKAIKTGEVDAESDVFKVEDEFLDDLREFVSSHDEKEIERVRNLPINKWTHLPDGCNYDNFLSLQKKVGVNKITGMNFSEGMFISLVKVDEGAACDSLWGFKRELYNKIIVNSAEALKVLKTTADDNKRKADTLSCNKYEIEHEFKNFADLKFVDKKEYGLTPKRKKIIEAANEKGGLAFTLDFFEKSIKTENERNEFHNICSLAQTTGADVSVTEDVVMKLEEFAIKLREAKEERAESKVVPVFYYANMENNEG